MSGPGSTIAVCHLDLGLGGAERFVVDSALELQGLGSKVHVYTSHYDPQRYTARPFVACATAPGIWLLLSRMCTNCRNAGTSVQMPRRHCSFGRASRRTVDSAYLVWALHCFLLSAADARDCDPPRMVAEKGKAKIRHYYS
jgi:hypothetical protein